MRAGEVTFKSPSIYNFEIVSQSFSGSGEFVQNSFYKCKMYGIKYNINNTKYIFILTQEMSLL